MVTRTVSKNPRTTRGDLVNDLLRAGTKVTKATISNTLRRQGLKSCSARRVPLLKPVHVQARLKFAREHLDDPEEDWENVIWSDETFLVKTQLVVFGGERMLSCIQRTPYLLWSMGWKHHALGLFFCKGTRTTDLCKGKNEWGHVSWDFWVKTSFHQQGHWRWNVAGSFSMTMIPNTPPGQRRSGFVRSISRSWSGLASLQISTP